MEENILCNNAADQYHNGHDADQAYYSAVLAAPFLHIISAHKEIYIAVHDQKTDPEYDDERYFEGYTCYELIHINSDKN